MKLRWYIHDRHCLTVETGGGHALPEIEWTGEALRRVSAGWDRAPDRHTIEMWLRGAIPENGSLETFERRAHRTFEARNIRVGSGTVHDWVWGDADWEYPGALRFERAEDEGTTHEPDGYTPINEAELGDRLREVAEEADRVRRARPRRRHNPKSSLSGARGKIAIHIDDNERMYLPMGKSLSSWIAKVEHRHEWPGEAGLESICQRALLYLEIDSAVTTARVINGIPTVMSKRSDRVIQQGIVVARHQEDWLQAYGKGPGFKYDEGGQDSGYASLYAILRRYAEKPDAETKQITRVLAAACAMCNGDLHRKNIAIAHGPTTSELRVKLAPIYDFSSQAGAHGTGDNLTIRIAGMMRAWEVDENRWRKLAEQCRLDPDDTIKTARETALYAPEALATARAECRDTDEWQDAKVVEQRVDDTIRVAERYARILRGDAQSKPGKISTPDETSTKQNDTSNTIGA